LKPEAILCSTTPALRALRDGASGIPIVFVAVTDPVGQGLISNLARPDGNITGFLNYDSPMAGKWLSLLRDLVPGLRRAAPFFNPRTAPYGALMVHALEEDAQSLGIAVEAVPVSGADGIDADIASVAGNPGSGLIVLPDGFTVNFRTAIIAAAARYKLPAIYPYTFFVQEGGLISYGIDVADLFRNAAGYVDRILKGARPADLPVQAPTKFETALNLKTAKTLGLTPSLTLQAMAEVVIE
jgi:putative tryptophan/tyrosine transport system substrate-binding protein